MLLLQVVVILGVMMMMIDDDDGGCGSLIMIHRASAISVGAGCSLFVTQGRAGFADQCCHPILITDGPRLVRLAFDWDVG